MPRPHQGQLLPRTCQEEPEDTDGQRAAAGRTANLRSAFGPNSRSPLLEIPGLGPRNFQNPEALSFHSTSREGMPVTAVLRDGPAGTHGDLRAPPEKPGLAGSAGELPGRLWKSLAAGQLRVAGTVAVGGRDAVARRLAARDFPRSPHFLRPPAPDQNRLR